MTIGQRIVSCLGGFGDPVAMNQYTGTSDRYYVYMFGSRGDNHADDAPNNERYYVTIHFYAPMSWTGLTERRKQTKKALYDAGFDYPEVHSDIDDNMNWLIFSCEYVDEVEVELDGV